MSIHFRRFEILLPLRFNDGTPVSPDLLADTFLELRQRFGAVSVETQTIRGQWQHQGQVYQDELVRVFLDVQDSQENREFFLNLKQQLRDRFEQLDIWMTSHPIDVI